MHRKHLQNVRKIFDTSLKVTMFCTRKLTCLTAIDCVCDVFIPECDSLRSGLCYRKSVCRLSVCNVRAPYSGVKAFGNISSPQCTIAILWHRCKILRRLSQGNPFVGVVKRKRGSKIERFLTCQRLYLINGTGCALGCPPIGNDTTGMHCCNFQWPWPIRNPDFKVIGVFRRQ